MKNTKIKDLLSSLVLFRDLLDDDVIRALIHALDCDEEDKLNSYSEFLAKLYCTSGGDLAAHIKKICESNENVYVKMCGKGKMPPAFMEKTLYRELEILDETASLTRYDIISGDITDAADFASGNPMLTKTYPERVGNIGKYGYGIYADNLMFFVTECGAIETIKSPDPIRLSDLKEYELEREAVIENTRALVAGKPAANVLLTGDAGSGKSSTVKASVNEFGKEGLRIIEVRKDRLTYIPHILDLLCDNPLKFIIFIDDISFESDDDNYNALKAVLEGSVCAKAPNVAIYATSNRRHIIKEKFSDREGSEIHLRDSMQEAISLSDRFGLHITFSSPSKAVYLNIVHHLAKENGIDISFDELDLLAERFALGKGGRSPRAARQFIDSLISR